MVALDNTYGALLIGVLVAGILYGFTCIQSWYYYTQYPKDPWYLKLLVGSTLLLDTIHQAVITSAIYTYLVTNFGKDELGLLLWSDMGEVFFNAITTLLVQCFLVVRIWKLSNGNWFMAGSSMVLVLAEFVTAFYFAVKCVHMTTFEEVITLKPVSLTINALSAGGDALIAGYLCYLLQKSRTGFHKSEKVINKLIVFTVNTGLLTSLCALASFISYNACPKGYIYLAFYFNIGRLYCNSLLATLNARKRLRGEGHDDDITLSCQGNSNQAKLTTSSKNMPGNISIKIETTQEFIRDEFSSSNGDLKDPGVVV